MSVSQSTYSRTLDEILGFNVAAAPNKSVDDRPIPPQRKNPPGSRSSENNSANSSLLNKNIQERPTTRHGRSSQSESSSSSKNENNTNEPDAARPSSIDVWNREESVVRRNTLKRSVNQPSTILEQERPPSIESSSISPDRSSSFHDDFIVEQKPEQFETSIEPFKLSSSSNNSSQASHRTYNTKMNENHESLLNSSLRIHSSSSSNNSKISEQKAKQPVEAIVAETITKPTLERIARPITKVPPRQPPARPKSTAAQKKPDLEAQRAKLKSSMSTRQLLNENSPNYNLWLQRNIAEKKRKQAEEKAKKEEEERIKTEKKLNAEKVFQHWKEEHDRKRAEEQRQKRRKLKESEREKEEALKEKRRIAEKTFEHWKQTQDEKRQAERLAKIKAQRQRTQSAEAQKTKQKQENQKAYNLWCETLNARMREDRMIKETQEEKRQTQLEKDKAFRDSLAKEAYDLWLEMKRKEKLFSESLAYKILDYDVQAKKRWPAAPWIPPTSTVPRKFVGTGNRRRTLEKPLTIVRQRARSTASLR